MQAEVAKLQWASGGLARQLVEATHEQDSGAAWVHSSTTLAQSSSERHSTLHNAAITTIMIMLPVGTNVPDRL